MIADRSARIGRAASDPTIRKPDHQRCIGNRPPVQNHLPPPSESHFSRRNPARTPLPTPSDAHRHRLRRHGPCIPDALAHPEFSRRLPAIQQSNREIMPDPIPELASDTSKIRHRPGTPNRSNHHICHVSQPDHFRQATRRTRAAPHPSSLPTDAQSKSVPRWPSCHRAGPHAPSPRIESRLGTRFSPRIRPAAHQDAFTGKTSCLRPPAHMYPPTVLNFRRRPTHCGICILHISRARRRGPHLLPDSPSRP